MSSKRLQNAAAAAGFAMVNPDDFAGEASVVSRNQASLPNADREQPAARSWLSWEYLRLIGSKAPA